LYQKVRERPSEGAATIRALLDARRSKDPVFVDPRQQHREEFSARQPW